MRIVVDVMGGDHGSAVVIDGVKAALQAPGQERIREIYLVGNEAEIQAGLGHSRHRDPRLQIVHASEVMTMDEKPVVALRKKKDCSIARAVELVKDGKADAVISPGNTGGMVAAATLKLRPLPGVDRPGIAAVMPGPDNDFVLLDAGANIDCRPRHLLHYAIMGSLYSRHILGYEKPRVGLLSVGTEDVKGNDLTLEAFKLCKQMDNFNFIGNVEGHDLFTNRVDVVVCDGFVGNIVLKTCESLAKGFFSWLKRELKRAPHRAIGAFLAQAAFRTIKRRVDPDNVGGAPLLGLNGSVMIAHGSASANAIKNAIHLTAETLTHHLNEHIQQEIAQATTKRWKNWPPHHSPKGRRPNRCW
ncbi:MAG: phosphate acyltransferase PlsX [Verrucomicrobia bacterium]|nr:phosphate acyltransferase PlsX [Verrucomicrobiota bacterium]